MFIFFGVFLLCYLILIYMKQPKYDAVKLFEAKKNKEIKDKKLILVSKFDN